jgi:two-component system, OmpR family, sensor histidine kinase QseC
VRQQALHDTLRGCDRASRVVEQLLTLARVEGPQDVSSEPFRLNQLAQQVMADLTPEALRRGQKLELLAPDAIKINGQSTLWEILLRNLIDNALRYSPDGAVVQIEMQNLDAKHVKVTVQDSGAGLSSADMARLGERFFRVLGNSATGSGLGWSIVRHIASLQQIDVQVGRSEKLGGLQVTLRVSGL